MRGEDRVPKDPNEPAEDSNARDPCSVIKDSRLCCTAIVRKRSNRGPQWTAVQAEAIESEAYFGMERVKGIEPSYSAWKSRITVTFSKAIQTILSHFAR
jgi:hypothetical protein